MKKHIQRLAKFLRKRAKTIALATVTLVTTAYGLALYGGAPHFKNDYPRSPLLPSESCAVTIQKEFAARAQAANRLQAVKPVSERISVIVIPGFLLDDAFMTPMTKALKAQGFDAHGWGAGRNQGAEQQQVNLFLKKLESVYEQNGKQPVFLVGYSAGGIHAREAARLHPEMVRGVVTIATPFDLKTAEGKLDPAVVAIRQLYASSEIDMAKPPSVPTTSIFSFDDVAFPWRGALNATHAKAENIPMQGGHISIVFRADVLALLYDRLQEDPSTWQALSNRLCKLDGKRLG